MELYADKHAFNSGPAETTPPLLASSSTLPPITNSSNSTYTTGNLTFEPQPELTINNRSLHCYIYKYDYGDNSTIEQFAGVNSTHWYKRPGNYSYQVEAYAINLNSRKRAYHASYNGTVVILGENLSHTLLHYLIYVLACIYMK